MTVFIPILLFVCVVIGFAATNLILTHIIGPINPTPVKDSVYESGMDPVGDARQHFDVKFYIIAVLFLVFDLELIFLYPWAVSAYAPEGGLPIELRQAVFGVMIVFLSTLAIGYVYAWRKGVFQWR